MNPQLKQRPAGWATRKMVVRLAVISVLLVIASPILQLVAMVLVSTVTGWPASNDSLSFVASIVSVSPALLSSSFGVMAAVLHLRTVPPGTHGRKFPAAVCVICSLIIAYALYIMI